MPWSWIAVETSFPRHPKTRQAAILLKRNRHQVMGYLLCLWTWAFEFTPDGRPMTAEEIKNAAEWPGEAETFCEALADDGARYLDRADGGYCIHDFEEHIGRFTKERDRRRKLAAERQRVWREKNDVTRLSRVSNALVTHTPYQTIPDHTRPYQTIPREEAAAASSLTRGKEPPPQKSAFIETLGEYCQREGIVPIWGGIASEDAKDYAAEFQKRHGKQPLETMAVYAVSEAASHNVRQWAYVKGVLKTCMNLGRIPTPSEKEQRKERTSRSPPTQATAPNPEGWNPQTFTATD